jgi:hypothetical protein
MPYEILTLGRDGEALTINRLRLFNDQEIITILDDDNIWTNSNFRSKRPNEHELIVYDEQDNEVLHIIFMNKLAISITGVFRRPGHGAVKITPDYIITPRQNMYSGNCIEGPGSYCFGCR